MRTPKIAKAKTLSFGGFTSPTVKDLDYLNFINLEDGLEEENMKAIVF